MLHHHIQRMNYSEVEKLLQEGGDVNAFHEGRTAIEIAIVDLQDLRMVQLLLKNGANPRYSSCHLLESAATTYQPEICAALKPFYTSSERCAVDC
jgi:hypothetical protein